jgi:hypothetical protein
MTTPFPEPEVTPEKAQERSTHEKLDIAKAARLRLALTAEGEELFDLIQDPDPDVLRSVFRNPHLSEQHLLSLMKRRDLSEQVLRAIQRSPAGASSRRVKVALASHPNTPAAVLSPLLPQMFLFELVAVMQLSGVGADQKLAAERAIIKRLPETELGNKMTLARLGSPGVLEALLKTGEPRLAEVVLANPKLKEAGVLAFLNSATATAETISAVGRHQRWGGRPNLRFAMLRNRKTPRIWFTLFLPGLPSSQVKDLMMSKQLTAEQLQEVREELQKRSQSS